MTVVITPPAHRDAARARQRYQRWTKAALVDRLLAVETAHVEQEERWLALNDELLTWRLRAEPRDDAPRLPQEAPNSPLVRTVLS